jgi:hypothetical protein
MVYLKTLGKGLCRIILSFSTCSFSQDRVYPQSDSKYFFFYSRTLIIFLVVIVFSSQPLSWQIGNRKRHFPPPPEMRQPFKGRGGGTHEVVCGGVDGDKPMEEKVARSLGKNKQWKKKLFVQRKEWKFLLNRRGNLVIAPECLGLPEEVDVRPIPHISPIMWQCKWSGN